MGKSLQVDGRGHPECHSTALPLRPEPFNEFRAGSAEGLSVSSAQDAYLQGECADQIINIPVFWCDYSAYPPAGYD